MQTKQIHIKATCENENRRFCISEAKFDTLKQLISNLFSLANDAVFIVKYKDDENDFVTISSDEELLFAVNLAPANVLRVVIEVPKQQAVDVGCSTDPNCADPCSWRKKCDRPMDERRNQFLAAKKEKVLAKIKDLEGSDFQANPKLFWKQEHLKRKLQNIDHKLGREAGENKHCGKFDRCPRPMGDNYWNRPMSDQHCNRSMNDKHGNFFAAKKERILARLRELEGMDFQAHPGLLWKQEHLKKKLEMIEAKLADKETSGPNWRGKCGRGRGFGHGHGHGHGFGHGHGHGFGHGHGYGHGYGHGFGHAYRDAPGHHHGADESGHLAAKKERILACLKRMEGADFQAHPGLFWKQEHLKKKLAMIEAKLAQPLPAAETGSIETVVPPFTPVPFTQTTPGDKEDTKRIREALKLEKQQAVAHCQAKKLEFQTAQRAHQSGDQQRKEEIAKLHEEYMQAQEIAFEKKKALGEFNATTRASRDQAKN